jgi:two-component system OmpR family response regulator/two-component system alkaline phosphatase synthesis response regulator PhoP
LLRRPPRVHAHGQPSGGRLEPSEQPVHVHDVDIDPARRRVRVAGRDIELTDQEFRLLYLLATHAGIVFSREALLSKIWRGDTFVTVRSVDTLVKRLRRRIETNPKDPRLLLTVWGVGYKFADV